MPPKNDGQMGDQFPKTPQIPPKQGSQPMQPVTGSEQRTPKPMGKSGGKSGMSGSY